MIEVTEGSPTAPTPGKAEAEERVSDGREDSSVAHAEPGLRERKKQRTRVALADAARGLFLENGFDAVTVDEIAARADVSRRTFFRYFATKEAAAFPYRDRWLSEFSELIERTGGVDAYDVVQNALLRMATLFMENRELMVSQHRIANGATALMAYQRDVDRLWAEAIGERLRADFGSQKARLIGAAMMGVIRATLDEWYAQGAVGDLREMGVAALALVERGARPAR